MPMNMTCISLCKFLCQTHHCNSVWINRYSNEKQISQYIEKFIERKKAVQTGKWTILFYFIFMNPTWNKLINYTSTSCPSLTEPICHSWRVLNSLWRDMRKQNDWEPQHRSILLQWVIGFTHNRCVNNVSWNSKGANNDFADTNLILL